MRDLRSVAEPSQKTDELPGRARKKDEEPGKKPEPVQRTAYAKYSDGIEDSFYIPPVSKDKKHTKPHTLDGDGETGHSAEISDPSPTGNDQKTSPPVSVPETASNGQQTEGHPSTQKQTQETLLVRKNSPLDVANVLEAMFDFATFRDQLYRYEEANGFWKLIPESEVNRELRRLIPEEFANSVNKSALAEIYEWLLVRAISMGEDDEARRFFLNFADCAVDWRTKTVINRRKNLFFVYYDHASGGCSFNINTPKTKAGCREIPMSDQVKEAFLEEKEFESFMDYMGMGKKETDKQDMSGDV